MAIDVSWKGAGACNGEDVDLFFSHHDEDQERALAYCDRCLVIDKCLEFAIATRQVYGIWGGMTERQRRSLRRRQASRV